MNSNQKNSNDDSKKQPPASSTMKIYDEGIDSNKKQEHPRRANRTNVLANANNKFEAEQEGEQVPQHSWKKKKKQQRPHQQKKKHWNKNRKTNGIVNGAHHNWTMNDSDHSRNSGSNENHRRHTRNNNPDHRSYEQGKMSANHGSMESEPPFSQYIPGNQHTFPIPHPQHSNRQQQQHLFADDGNAKILLERQGNGNGVLAGDSQYIADNSNGNVNGTQWNDNMENSTSCKWWVGMIDRNTKVDAVVINIGGNIHHVPLPPKVGACLMQELLIQKENFMNGNNIDRIGSEASESFQGSNPQANASSQGFGEDGDATAASTATWEHGVPYSMATNLGHPQSYPYPYIEGQVLYGADCFSLVTTVGRRYLNR